MSSPPDPNPDPSPEEEEIARLAALAALNESTISKSNSLFPAFPSTMQLQGEVFVLRHNFIDEADATEFYEQAQRYPSMKLTDCIQKQASELLNFRIMIDPEFIIIDRRLRHDWQTKLTVLQVAKLIIKYFSPNGLGECTLAETFSQVPFHYQIANHDHKNATFVRYNELVNNYERSKGPLSETQHTELILILEKRLAKGSQIQQDYLKAKAADNSPPHTWYSTMLRIGQVLAEARAMTNLIKSYGNRRRCTRFLRQQFHQTLVRRRRAERVLKHPHLHPPLRRDHSLRQCVPLA